MTDNNARLEEIVKLLAEKLGDREIKSIEGIELDETVDPRSIDVYDPSRECNVYVRIRYT